MLKKCSKDSRKSKIEAIHKHKPWEKSTGPTSDIGKKRSSRNADKGKASIRNIRKMISNVKRERLEMIRLLEKEYRIKIKF